MNTNYQETAKEGRKESQVSQAVAELNCYTEELLALAGRFEDRLRSVTTPVPPEQVERSNDMVLVPLAESIRDNTQRVATVIQWMRNLLGRIEL